MSQVLRNTPVAEGSATIRISNIELFCIENGEEFRYGSYNGLSIIYRVSDKYVHAGKLISTYNNEHQNGRRAKRIYDFTRTDSWKEIVKYWREHERNSENEC